MSAVRTTRTPVSQPRHERATVRSTVMHLIHEQLARQTWHEASTEARRVRLVRALRADRRARRAERTARATADAARRVVENPVLVSC